MVVKVVVVLVPTMQDLATEVCKHTNQYLTCLSSDNLPSKLKCQKLQQNVA